MLREEERKRERERERERHSSEVIVRVCCCCCSSAAQRFVYWMVCAWSVLQGGGTSSLRMSMVTHGRPPDRHECTHTATHTLTHIHAFTYLHTQAAKRELALECDYTWEAASQARFKHLVEADSTLAGKVRDGMSGGMCFASDSFVLRAIFCQWLFCIA